MNYAVIAAGEGSRLAKEGFALPKPMVTLHGEMLIDRLISVFMRNDAQKIHIIINEESQKLDQHLTDSYSSAVSITRRSTPSSLHSFYELLKTMDQTSAICLTTTDTVFKENEFAAYIAEFIANKEIDGLMAVTTFIDDESPLFVEVGSDGKITAFADKNDNQTPFISGGIYCLRGKALAVVTAAVENGTNRMRNFQRQLLENNVKLKAYPFSKIVDVDHIADIQTAERFLAEESLV